MEPLYVAIHGEIRFPRHLKSIADQLVRLNGMLKCDAGIEDVP
jgi:hypothetical protein